MSIIVPISAEEEVAYRWIEARERADRFRALPPIGAVRRGLALLLGCTGAAAAVVTLTAESVSPSSADRADSGWTACGVLAVFALFGGAQALTRRWTGRVEGALTGRERRNAYSDIASSRDVASERRALLQVIAEQRRLDRLGWIGFLVGVGFLLTGSLVHESRPGGFDLMVLAVDTVVVGLFVTRNVRRDVAARRYLRST